MTGENLVIAFNSFDSSERIEHFAVVAAGQVGSAVASRKQRVAREYYTIRFVNIKHASLGVALGVPYSENGLTELDSVGLGKHSVGFERLRTLTVIIKRKTCH